MSVRKPTPFATEDVLDGIELALGMAEGRLGWKTSDERKVQRARAWLIQARLMRGLSPRRDVELDATDHELVEVFVRDDDGR